MTLGRSITSLVGAAAVLLAVLLVAGCGGGDGGDATAAPAPPRTASGGPATVGVATSRLGQIVVDSKQVAKGDAVALTFARGTAAARVESTREDDA